MRSDIVPGARFADYELSDHTAKRRKLSEAPGPASPSLSLSAVEVSAPRTAARPSYSSNCTVNLRLDLPGLVTITTDDITASPTSIVQVSVLTGRFLSDADERRSKGSRTYPGTARIQPARQ